jgi:protein SCO1
MSPTVAGVKKRLAPAALLAASAVGLLGLSACGSQTTKVELTSLKGYTSVPGKPLGPATGTLQQSDGKAWSFAHPEAGKVTLVFFGFTHCHDECPTTMSDLASALKRVPESVANKVAVEFVSADPDRDSLPVLKRYVRRYDPTFLAGRAPIEQIVTDARSYGIAVTATPKAKEVGDYQVEHGLQVAVLDKNGGEVGFFEGLAGAKAYAAALPALVEKYA